MAEDGLVTIPSAVLVPGDSPPRLNKRRTSSSVVEPTKRPRLSSEDIPPSTSIHDVTGSEDAQHRPEDTERQKQRRRLGLGVVEEQERKRGQRLFGALLGTIGKFQQDSQSARARAGANRRKEIEEKLQQKLKQQDQELDEKKRQESNLLKQQILKERKLFEERSIQLRHANMRARANYLCTKSRPPLYYLPWKLSIDDEDRIREQREEVEATIARELEEFERKRGRDAEDEGAYASNLEGADDRGNGFPHSAGGYVQHDIPAANHHKQLQTDDQQQQNMQLVVGKTVGVLTDGAVNPSNARSGTNKSGGANGIEEMEGEDGGEEVGTAGEDEVIY